MNLTSYLYKGPQSGAELRVQDGTKVELLEVKLNPGKTVELPTDHEYTKTLLAMKYLELAPVATTTEVDQPAAPAAPAPEVAKKGGKA